MTRYVLGFAFNETGEHVLLIRKTKPAWQAGKYNGIGGKIEPDEKDSVSAMVREFYEEAGVMTVPDNWTFFAEMVGPEWACDCFYTFNNFIFSKAETKTEEEVLDFPVQALPATISNLPWLIPAALNHKQNNQEFNLVAEYA